MKFHDLGKLCFAFTAFWGYFTFGQYLVNWYGNLAEETHWQRLRLIQPYLPFGLARGVPRVRDSVLRTRVARGEGVSAHVHRVREREPRSDSGCCATSRSIRRFTA